ncbi:MAG: tetratricopeptide repeat protein [bacterium]
MIVLMILIVALIACVMFLYFYRKHEKATGHTPYIEALIALLENRENLAMKKFKEAVSIDSDLVDAYVRLGDLYRKKGDVERAIQIHQSLTVRPTLNKHEEKKVYLALVNDMLEATRLNKATSFLKEIIKIDKKDKHARELILKIYEDMGNYVDCIALYEEGGIKPKDDRRHAFYYASLASSRLKNINDKDSDVDKEVVSLLKKALKITPDSFAALFQFASYYEQKGNLKKAKEYYHRIMTQHPDRAFSVVSKFEKVYFELGLFDEIIPIYEKIFQNNPKNFAVGFALAHVYEKKNDLAGAREVYGKLADVYPNSVLPKLRMVKASIKDKALKEKIAEMEATVAQEKYKCGKCGFTTDKFTLLCPKCHAIESFLLYL